MTDIDLDTLATVSGGFRWEGLRQSTNVEDRRDWTPAQNRNARPTVPPPTPNVPRYPGDLPSQAGLDDLIALGSRRRR